MLNLINMTKHDIINFYFLKTDMCMLNRIYIINNIINFYFLKTEMHMLNRTYINNNIINFYFF